MSPPPIPIFLAPLLIAGTLLLSGCKSTDLASETRLGGWEKRDVDGLYLELDSPDRVAQYWFNRGGSVALTLGEKNGDNGWVIAPLMFWYIKNGSLRIYAGNKRDFEEIKLVEKHPDHLVLQFGSNSPDKYFKKPTQTFEAD